MAKEQQVSKFTAQSLDEFSTGRPDKFIGTWVKALAYPFKGRKSTDNKYFLSIGVFIVPDEDSGYEPFWEPYSGGFLNEVVPSKDGKSPAGASDDDYLALGNGTTPEGLDVPVQDEKGNVIEDAPYVGEYILGQCRSNRSWNQAYICLKDSDTKGILDLNRPGFLGFANGLRCRFDRVPQTNDKEFKVLVVSEILGKGDVKAKSASTTGKSTTSTATSDDDLSALIIAEIGVQTKKDPNLKKGNLIASVPKALIAAGSIEKSRKADVMAWIGENWEDD